MPMEQMKPSTLSPSRGRASCNMTDSSAKPKSVSPTRRHSSISPCGNHCALTDYSKFKADIGSAKQRDTLPSTPTRHHGSSSQSRSPVPRTSHMEASTTTLCTSATKVGNRTSLEKLEQEMQRIMAQVAEEQQETKEHEACPMLCTSPSSFDGDEDDTVITMESLQDPFDLTLPIDCSNNKDNRQNKYNRSELSLTPADVFLGGDEHEKEATGCCSSSNENHRNNSSSFLMTQGQVSMPMLGLSPVPMANPLASFISPTRNRSMPALMLASPMGPHRSPCLTNFMESIDEDKIRQRSSLQGTKCHTEDLRAEMMQIVEQRRTRALPGRSKTWDASLQQQPRRPSQTKKKVLKTRPGGRSPIRRTKSDDTPGEAFATIRHCDATTTTCTTTTGATTSKGPKQMIQRRHPKSPQAPKTDKEISASLSSSFQRSSIRKSKSVDDNMFCSPMAVPVGRRFRRHRNSGGAKGSSNSTWQHLNSSSGRLLYDYHSDILGNTSMSNFSATSAGAAAVPARSTPSRTKSHDGTIWTRTSVKL